MSWGFFIIGGCIFAAYIYLMFWNIKYSAKQSKKENYPNYGSEGANLPDSKKL